MGICKKIWMVATEGLNEWKRNYRIWTILTVIAVVLGRYTLPVSKFALENELTTPITIFPLLMGDAMNSNGLPKVILFFGGIALLSNAPFIDKQKRYLLIRSGRKNWYKGECLYFILASLIYLLWTTTVTCIYLAPTISLTHGWGSLIGAIAGGSINRFEALNGIQCPVHVVNQVNYWIAVLYSYGSAWMILIILGFLIYAINLYSKKRWIGIAAAVFLVLIDPVLYNLTSEKTNWYMIFSPVSWTSMENLQYLSGRGLLTGSYVVITGTAMMLILGGIIGRKVKRMDLFSEQ